MLLQYVCFYSKQHRLAMLGLTIQPESTDAFTWLNLSEEIQGRELSVAS